MSVPWDAPHTFWNGYSLPVGFGVAVIRGDTQPDMDLSASASADEVDLGETFEIETTVSNPSHPLSGVHLENPDSLGVQLTEVTTEREDGVTMDFESFGQPASDFTLGNIIEGTAARPPGPSQPCQTVATTSNSAPGPRTAEPKKSPSWSVPANPMTTGRFFLPFSILSHFSLGFSLSRG